MGTKAACVTSERAIMPRNLIENFIAISFLVDKAVQAIQFIYHRTLRQVKLVEQPKLWCSGLIEVVES
jgi:hypothetical protein